MTQPSKSVRQLVTPEGVGLWLFVGGVFERLIAFCLDCFFLLAAGGISLFVLAIGEATLDASIDESWISAFSLILFFLGRNFYFLIFELLWSGRTPGKRIMNLRVVDGRGRPLTPGAIFARNATRELELFLPLIVLFSADQFWPGAPWAAQLFSGLWTVLLLFFPLLNADRLRAGDVLAGTMVVREPKPTLLRDVGVRAAQHARASAYTFSPDQLDMYGIYELQVLEGFLRGAPEHSAAISVGERIAHKIAWDGGQAWRKEPIVFLNAFYQALRGRREQRMLLGDRQERKKEGRLEKPKP